MNDGKIKLKLDKYEKGIIVNALNEFRNKLIRENKSPEYVDNVILKVMGEKDKGTQNLIYER